MNKKTQLILQWVVPIVAGLIFFLGSGAGTAVECGPDEGMEFAKALLVALDPHDLAKCWNDQPWFSSLVCAKVYAACGYRPWGMRLLSLSICIGMSILAKRLLPRGADWPHYLFFCLFLWVWPYFNQLCVAAMIDLPAFSLAIIASALLPLGHNEWRPLRFGASGLCFALALHVKLTSALVLPAAAFLMLRTAYEVNQQLCAAGLPGKTRLPAALFLPPLCGLAVFIVGFMIISLLSPSWSFASLWASHQAAGKTAAALKYSFPAMTLLGCPGLMLAALLGLFMLWRQKRLREGIFPVVLFGTLLLVYTHHYPWWYYYGVQFGIPLALLGGWGVGELLRMACAKPGGISSWRKGVWGTEIALMLGLLPLAIWSAYDLPMTYAQARQDYPHEKVADSQLVAALKPYHGLVKWAYSRQNMWLVHNAYLLPPELTNLCRKRFWTGDITEAQVLQVVTRYDCELLILSSDNELKQARWKKFVENYVRVWSDSKKAVFVAKRLRPTPEVESRDYLNRLGL